MDKICDDLVDNTNLIDFAVHLGDIVNHNTGHVNGIGLPWYVNQYRNNLKAFLINHVNLPFHCVIGNHDVVDYEMNKGDPHNLTKSSLREGLNSDFLSFIRENEHLLETEGSPCALFAHQEELEVIATKFKAHKVGAI